MSQRLVVVAEASAGGLWEAAIADAEAGAALGFRTELLAPPNARTLPSSPSIVVQEVKYPTSARRFRDIVRARKRVRATTAAASVVHVHGLRGLLLVLPHPGVVLTYHGAKPLSGRTLATLITWLTLHVAPLLVSRAFTVVPLPAKGWELVWYTRGSSGPARVQGGEHRREGRPKMLWVGRVVPQKDFGMFLDVAEKCVHQRLVEDVAVAGAFTRDPLGLEARARRQGVRLLGHVESLGQMLNDGDWIMCLFSRFEGRPFAVEEAIRSGTPVVVSRLPGNEMMIGRGSRFLVGTVEEACAAIAALAEPAQRDSVASEQLATLESVSGRLDYSAQLRIAYLCAASHR